MAVKESNTRITITVPKELYEKLGELAEFEDRSLSNTVLMILKLYFRSRKRSKTS